MLCIIISNYLFFSPYMKHLCDIYYITITSHPLGVQHSHLFFYLQITPKKVLQIENEISQKPENTLLLTYSNTHLLILNSQQFYS